MCNCTNSETKIFSGRSNLGLSKKIAEHLNTNLSEIEIKNFADGEIYVKIKESVRGDDIFIIQSLSPPVNENLMELLIAVDAFKRASAKSITAVIPYFGYARQDRKTSGREAITAKLVADLLTTAGVDRVVTLDLHAGQVQGFFNILVDNLSASKLLINSIKRTNDTVIVSPDMGGVTRSSFFSKKMEFPLAIIDKVREQHNVAHASHIIGDVYNKDCVIIDDIIDTAGTICEAARILKENGAKDITVCCTHPLFSGPAISRLESAPIDKVIVTDTIHQEFAEGSKFGIVSVSDLLAKVINNISNCMSVSDLF